MVSSSAVVAIPTTTTSLCHPKTRNSEAVRPRICNLPNAPNKPLSLLINGRITVSHLSSSSTLSAHEKNVRRYAHLSPKAASFSSVLSSEYMEEPETKVKFQTSLSLPGCSSSLSLLGTGYREKVFAIIGVKVYAAGFYANEAIFSKLDAWKGRSVAEVQQDSSLFSDFFQVPLEKSLHIILVRDVDGKTFWDALDEAISPRITSPTSVDKSALSTFRSTFEGRPLKKGTSIFLTWLDTAKMLVCVSSDGMPTSVDATIESSNVTSALFDVFLGGNPVSPSLKASTSKGLTAVLSN